MQLLQQMCTTIKTGLFFLPVSHFSHKVKYCQYDNCVLTPHSIFMKSSKINHDGSMICTAAVVQLANNLCLLRLVSMCKSVQILHVLLLLSTPQLLTWCSYFDFGQWKSSAQQVDCRFSLVALCCIVIGCQTEQCRHDTRSLVFLPSVECRRETEKGAQADRHEQRAEDRHHGRQGQTPLGLDHVDLTCGGGQRWKTLRECVTHSVKPTTVGCHHTMVCDQVLAR